MEQVNDTSVTHLHEPTPEQMLEIMFSYASTISLETDLDRLLLMMADLGRELIVADRCTLWLVDESKNRLWTKVAHGIDRIDMPMDSGLVGVVMQTGQSIVVEDAYSDPRFNRKVDIETGYRTKSVLCIPIRDFDGRIMGVYQAINKRTADEHFSSKDLRHLSLASSYIGKSIQTAMLHAELLETQREIIFTLGEIGESRSRETGMHVKRVAAYSYELACLYGLSEIEARLLELASPMHDIGKVSIPDAILNKPGKLTEEEFNQMKLHTEVGYSIFKGSKRNILKAAAIIAHEHHERWNGTGYPNRKSGEDIHLYARITALADVFDALGSERSYKKAWPLDDILDLIRSERGKHFDPKLVDLFLANLERFLAIREQYKE